MDSLRPAPVRPVRFLFLPLLSFFLWMTLGAAEEKPRSAPAPAPGAPSSGAISLDSWRTQQKEMEEAIDGPQGPERIARCEAFLNDHPDCDDPGVVRRTLLDDYLETGRRDPTRLARLIQEEIRAREGAGAGAWWKLTVLERYILRYGLPLGEADSLLDGVDKWLQSERKNLRNEMDPDLRDPGRLEGLEARLHLDRGRVRLARGDAAGALKELRLTEAAADRAGWTASLREPGGSVAASLPTGYPFADRLEISMAEAEQRLGNRSAALRHLSRVRNFGDFYGEIPARVEAFRESLKVAAPIITEVRGTPVPAPDFTLEDQEGKPVSLSNYRGKVVMMTLWTTT